MTSKFLGLLSELICFLHPHACLQGRFGNSGGHGVTNLMTSINRVLSMTFLLSRECVSEPSSF